MDQFSQVPLNQIQFTKENLYREDSYTDMQVGSIRVLTPVKPDGTEDSTRTPLFIGQAQVMSPKGPLPVQGAIEAKSLVEAMEKFPQAMAQVLKKMISDFRNYQREQESGLILPDK